MMKTNRAAANQHYWNHCDRKKAMDLKPADIVRINGFWYTVLGNESGTGGFNRVQVWHPDLGKSAISLFCTQWYAVAEALMPV